MSGRAEGRDEGRDGPGPGGPEGSGGIAVVVVNYESGPALARCVERLRQHDLAELVVVDNGSRDGSLDELRRRVPGVIVVDPGANLGYGAAANRGAAATSAPALLVCNSDLEVGPESIAILARELDLRSGCGAVGPLIRDADGRPYPSARRFPSMIDAAGHAMLGLFAPDNRFTRSYHQADLAGTSGTREVDWLSGACLMLRRCAFEEVGGFDESYFMYAEDVDLCWRLARAGWKAAYAQAAEVTHLQGVSTEAHPYRMILEHHRSLLRFAARSSVGWRKALLPLVAAGLAVRVGLAGVARLTRR
ncbi:MAG: glycosyltransferase family 2 protein [Acidimicrobiales bacterium]